MNSECVQVLLEIEDALTKSQNKVKFLFPSRCHCNTAPLKDIRFSIGSYSEVKIYFGSGKIKNKSKSNVSSFLQSACDSDFILIITAANWEIPKGHPHLCDLFKLLNDDDSGDS